MITLTKPFPMRLLAMLTAAASCVLVSLASAQTPPPPAPPSTKQPPITPPVPKEPAPDQKPSDKPDDSGPVAWAIMSTSKGDIAIELDRKNAPISVANFLKYADDEYYNGTVFHRVIAGFMIQGGGYTADIQPKPGLEAAIKNEWQNGLKNKRGTLAMARLGGRPDSATSQFFINVADNDFLDQPRDGAGYAVFAKVVAGMNAVDAIRAVQTGHRNGMGDVPMETVEIKSVKRATKEEIDAMIAAEKTPTAPAAPAETPK